MARLGEMYLYARFRDTVPAILVEEFDRPKPAPGPSDTGLKTSA